MWCKREDRDEGLGGCEVIVIGIWLKTRDIDSMWLKIYIDDQKF